MWRREVDVERRLEGDGDENAPGDVIASTPAKHI